MSGQSFRRNVCYRQPAISSAPNPPSVRLGGGESPVIHALPEKKNKKVHHGSSIPHSSAPWVCSVGHAKCSTWWVKGTMTTPPPKDIITRAHRRRVVVYAEHRALSAKPEWVCPPHHGPKITKPNRDSKTSKILGFNHLQPAENAASERLYRPPPTRRSRPPVVCKPKNHGEKQRDVTKVARLGGQGSDLDSSQSMVGHRDLDVLGDGFLCPPFFRVWFVRSRWQFHRIYWS